MRVRILIVFIMIALTSVFTYGQQKPIFSQYMFNGLAINPAYAGNQKMLSASSLYRKQWFNVPGSPNTQTFAFHSQLKRRAANMGLGLLLSRDEIGAHRQYDAFGVYAYRVPLSRKAVLAMGLQAGLSNLNSDYSQVVLKQPGDPLFIAASEQRYLPNFGAGLYYYRSDLTYIGFSIPYMMRNRLVFIPDEIGSDSSTIAREARSYFLTGGIMIPLSAVLKLKPSILFKMQEGDVVNGSRSFSPIGIDLNGVLIIKDMIAAGLSYRKGDGMNLVGQMQLNKNFQVGVSYDLTLSTLIIKSRGSFEFMVQYRFNLSPDLCPVFH